MIVPNADRTHAYQIDNGWGAAVHLFEVERTEDGSGRFRLLIHTSVNRATFGFFGDYDAACAELEHLCRLSGWRPRGDRYEPA